MSSRPKVTRWQGGVLYRPGPGHMFEPMDGKGRSRVLAVRSPDPVLSVVAPLGLAATLTTCLVVDLIDDLRLSTTRTLSDIAADGPRLEELSPGRPGVALIAAGPIGVEDAEGVIAQLALRWPAVVVRVGTGSWPGPTVPVVPIFPGLLAQTRAETAVWQPVGAYHDPPGPGPLLPRLRSGLARRLLAGQMPGRTRWVRAWRPVWELPWA